MWRAWLACLLLIAPGAAAAQSWASRDACAIGTPQIGWADFAPLSEAEARAAAANIPNGEGRFWRIDGGAAPSYLWGTMHSTDPAILALPDPLHDAIASARIVALEIDPIAASRAELADRAAYTGAFRDDPTPFDFNTLPLDPRVTEAIRNRMESIGWGRDAPDYLTLGMLAEILLYHPCDDFAAGILPIQDSRIQMLGMIAGAEITGLEPSDRVLTYLNAPENYDIALAMIEIYGANLLPPENGQLSETGPALYLSDQIGLWMVADRLYIQRTLGQNRGAEMLDRMDAYLVTQRNHDFMTSISPELGKGGVVIAVGAFHLPGEEGMVQLLQQAGYHLTRLPTDGETR